MTTIDPTVPQALDQLIARMLAKSPADRPQTMRDLLVELDAIKAALGVVTSPPGGDLGGPTPSGRVLAGGTMLLPQPAPAGSAPKQQTTLASASSEKLAGFGQTAKVSHAKAIWASVIAFVVVGGAIGIWQAIDSGPVSRRGRREDDRMQRPAEPAIAARAPEPEMRGRAAAGGAAASACIADAAGRGRTTSAGPAGRFAAAARALMPLPLPRRRRRRRQGR